MSASGQRLLAAGVAATALVQAGNAFSVWDRALANRLLLASVFALVGAVVASRRGAFGWTCLAIAVAGAVLPVPEPAGVELWLALFPLALLLFPSGRLPSRRWAGALVAAILAPVCLALGAAPALMAVALLPALAALAGRLRHPSERVRRRVLYLLLGSAAALFALALDSAFLPGAWVLGALAIPAAAGVALLCDPLYELDLAFSRLLVSREALVTAREDERRRLRRDLHDGLGPRLAAMTLRIDVALELLEREPARVADVLVTLRDESQRAIADIRRVAYGLRPPALDELGLIGAIEETTEQLGVAERFDVDLDLPDAVPALPAAIEVAALRIVQEALANVAHHSGARACGVRLEVDGAVAIEVSDDGDGLPDDYRPGIGLHSMRERAAELGGTCAIEPRRPSGTRVRAQLPLAVR
jgi:signal transduction histidine kinase